MGSWPGEGVAARRLARVRAGVRGEDHHPLRLRGDVSPVRRCLWCPRGLARQARWARNQAPVPLGEHPEGETVMSDEVKTQIGGVLDLAKVIDTVGAELVGLQREELEAALARGEMPGW